MPPHSRQKRCRGFLYRQGYFIWVPHPGEVYSSPGERVGIVRGKTSFLRPSEEWCWLSTVCFPLLTRDMGITTDPSWSRTMDPDMALDSSLARTSPWPWWQWRAFRFQISTALAAAWLPSIHIGQLTGQTLHIHRALSDIWSNGHTLDLYLCRTTDPRQWPVPGPLHVSRW